VRVFRSERWSAVLLIVAAALGIGLANSGVGHSIIEFTHLRLGFLSVSHWVTDGLLAIFFFLAAVELKHELLNGELSSPAKAIVPAAAALGGVIVPALVFVAVVHDPALNRGWPIPTATDIAFALGVLALVGRRLPSRVRALLLALAVLDDLIAIIIIAVFFTASVQWLPLLAAVPAVALFAILSRLPRRAWRVVVMVLLAIGTWLLVLVSGIHPTIAGVALGLAMAGTPGMTARRTLEPFSNGVVLPLFAFVAALVVIPRVGLGELSPVFWAIVIALPVGKLVGITGGALTAIAATRTGRSAPPLGDILVVASLGGIGFTVSLLMNQLAWRADETLVAEGTLGVIVASVAAAAIGSIVTTIRARAYR
jgi:NhaA family Na+:H+ antiporter